MPAAPKPPDEPRRLAALHALGILGTPPEERFDRLTRLAAQATDCPIALVSLVDAEEQFFKSHFGLEVCRADRETSFCGYTILGDEPLLIEDAATDPRTADNPLVTGSPGIRAYAGIPLRGPDGSRLGSFCVVDYRPRQFSRSAVEMLRTLAAIASDELAGVRVNRLVAELEDARRSADRANAAKGEFLAMMSHEIRTPLNGVIGFADLLGRTELTEEQREYVAGIQASGDLLLSLINDVLDFSKIEAGHLSLESKVFSVAAELETVQRMFAPAAASKGLELSYRVGPGTPTSVWG
ncbi:MAG: histidine kinase dimerization/phospho-acceptor domain-containing protein, partial [Verrucomicrobiia bacterium]